MTYAIMIIYVITFIMTILTSKGALTCATPVDQAVQRVQQPKNHEYARYSIIVFKRQDNKINLNPSKM